MQCIVFYPWARQLYYYFYLLCNPEVNDERGVPYMREIIYSYEVRNTVLEKHNKNPKRREKKTYSDDNRLLFVLFRIIPKVKSDFGADEYAFGNYSL